MSPFISSSIFISTSSKHDVRAKNEYIYIYIYIREKKNEKLKILKIKKISNPNAHFSKISNSIFVQSNRKEYIKLKKEENHIKVFLNNEK